jgi:uncharacterized protein
VPPAVVLAGRLLPSLVIGLPLGIVLLRRLEPESFRRVSMAASAAFIAFGLARSVSEVGLVPEALAYAGMGAVLLGEGYLLLRFFRTRR